MVAMAGVLAAPISVAHAQDGGGEQIDILRDTEIEAILHQEMDPIFAAANLDPKLVKLYLVGDDEMNAETGSGYNMIVTTGLIMQCKTPNELMGVLAHETGHMAAATSPAPARWSTRRGGPMVLAIGLGILAAIAGAPGRRGGTDLLRQLLRPRSTCWPIRATRSPAPTRRRSPIWRRPATPPQGWSISSTISATKKCSPTSKIPLLGRPPAHRRPDRGAVRRAPSAQPHWAVKDTPEMIAAVRDHEGQDQGLHQPAVPDLHRLPEKDPSFPARYARAIAYYRELETDKALKDIDALIAERPDDPYLYELKGQALMESSRAVEAEPALRKAVELNPDAPLLRILLGQDLLAENDPAKLDDAIAHPQPLAGVEPDNPLAWQYLSEAYDAKGEEGMARLATAEQNFHLGQMKDARAFAMRARDS